MKYHLCEISYGKFFRSIPLNFDIDPSKVKASFSKSVLTVKVAKPEKEITQSHAIPIAFE